jgi:uncharacterized SAM-dependent methyltransferase
VTLIPQQTRCAAGATPAVPTQFADDVREHLTRDPRGLPSKYFYDALGSCLFDAICELPWYSITRAEMRLLRGHGAAMLAPLGGAGRCWPVDG